MAIAANIDERTDLFIREYWKLKNDSQLPDNKTIAEKIGINSASTLSNILARRQNIKPEAWQAFRKLFLNQELPTNSEKPPSSEGGFAVNKLAQALADQAKANMDQAEGYKILAEAYKGMLEMMRDMRKEMARQDSQAIIKDKVEEMESSLDNVWNGLFVASTRQSVDREGVLSALSKLMGKPSDHLLKEANKRAAEIFEASGVPDKMPAKSR